MTLPGLVRIPGSRDAHDWTLGDDVGQVRALLAVDLPEFSARRETEHRLADKIHALIDYPGAEGLGLAHLCSTLWACRCDGVAGVADYDGTRKVRIQWADKCRQPKLCLDEARGESVRLFGRYAPSIAVATARGWHMTYAVFTAPNLAAGKLWAGLKFHWHRLARYLRRRGLSALVVMECPLGLDGHSWNLHFNVIVLSRAWLDYKALRAGWRHQVQFAGARDMARKFQARTGRTGSSAEVLASTFRELIKYSAKIAGETHHTGHVAGPGKLWAGLKFHWHRLARYLRRRGLSALVVMECPLGLDGHSWNLHFNVIVLSRAWLDYKALRAGWRHQVQFAGARDMARKFQARTGRTGSSAEVLASTFRELIKYSAKIAGETHHTGPHAGQHALPMLEWPAAQWLEWWRAMRGHRRSRGYGALYDPEGIRWAASSRAERVAWCVAADVGAVHAGSRWRINRAGAECLPTGVRRPIRAAMRAPARDADTRWVGALTWVRHVGYTFRAWIRGSLGLIPGQQVGSPARRENPNKSANQGVWGIVPVGSSP